MDPIAERANRTEDFADVVIAETEGIGTMLLRECCAIAQEKGYRKAVPETNEKLPDAKQFYIKAGFAKMASYGDLSETLCMKKEL